MTDVRTAPTMPPREVPPPETLARTQVRASFTIAPVGNVMGDVAGLLGEHVLALMGMFYPRSLCRKANVVITELVTNVLENVFDPESAMHVDVDVNGDALTIEVKNRVSPEQWEKVRARIQQIDETPNLRALVAQTLRERREKRLKGGLGLMRLSQENKFKLSAGYEGGTMSVKATYLVREAE